MRRIHDTATHLHTFKNIVFMYVFIYYLTTPWQTTGRPKVDDGE